MKRRGSNAEPLPANDELSFDEPSGPFSVGNASPETRRFMLRHEARSHRHEARRFRVRRDENLPFRPLNERA